MSILADADATRTDRAGVFADPELDRTLARESIAMAPMLSPAEVEEVLEAYREIAPPGESGLQVDYLRDDRRMMRAVAELVRPIWDRHFPVLFPGRRPVASSFLVKQPGADSTFILHRDLPVLDERHHRNYTLWIPLVDVGADIDNGGLRIARGTELFDQRSRGLDNMVLFDAYRPTIEQNLEPVEVPAGTAVVFDVRIVHGSPSNRTDTPRPAFGCLLALPDEPLVQVLPTGRRSRKVFAVDADFFIEHHPLEVRDHGMPDRYELIDEFEEDDAHVTPEAIQAVLGLEEPPTPIPQVPDDVVGDVDRSTLDLLPTLDSHVSIAAHDVAVDWDGLAGRLPADLGSFRAAPEHRWGAIDLLARAGRARRARQAVWPAWLDPRLLPAHDGTVRSSLLVALDKRTRLTGELPDTGKWELTVVDCPQVRSGVSTPDGVLQFDLGTRVILPSSATIQLWNDGPGSLVVELRRIRATGAPWTRLLPRRASSGT